MLESMNINSDVYGLYLEIKNLLIIHDNIYKSEIYLIPHCLSR